MHANDNFSSEHLELIERERERESDQTKPERRATKPNETLNEEHDDERTEKIN